MKPVLLWMLILAVAPCIEAQQPTSAPPQKSISSSLGLHTFPAKNQAAAQQQQDEMACYSWAQQDTGFDPLAALTAQQSPTPTAPASSAPQTRGAGVQGAAGGAARGAVVGAIAGDAGKGAEVGAAAGAVGGRVRARRAQEQAQKQAQQQQQQQPQQQAQAKAQSQQKLDGFKRGFAACMEAKGYVVK
jgi:hypothetical protein